MIKVKIIKPFYNGGMKILKKGDIILVRIFCKRIFFRSHGKAILIPQDFYTKKFD